ncbi:hypothetical protein G6L26_007555 [Agrobacterium radiobacter]|uniref:hypothetical protein n=1 Tax=Agrobacterium tumefaciens complex TaxID=1183400 RepID=UPI000761F251|nr:hypothetical protein [Agrobacterium tumefaciens]KWT88034.1 hypothetical protein ASB65_18555 [Agrobacterium tumefaciens str. B6]MQB28168.1 hypothetical protein [Agrobacterium tumefaciens]NTA05027.1 hypothetical protein [Agrobacterium tumefaciens]NTA91622.1 hypothetical protein [Agrobacterium tumefaciens]NTB12772.1 hypothetical protein [Agrobacterium tumefaciens]
MFTADDARKGNEDELDDRIAYAVRNNKQGNGAYLRIYHDDSFRHSIVSELERRGFKNVDAPSFCIKTDVYFEWD